MTIKPPPHNEQIEQAILGVYLNFPETQKMLNETLKLEDFHIPAHRYAIEYIYKYISTNTINKDSAVTPLLFLDFLERKNGALRQCGGRDYIVIEIVGGVSTKAGLDSLLGQLKELSLRRDIIAKCHSLINSCYDEFAVEIGDIVGDVKVLLESAADTKRYLSKEITEWVDGTEGYFSVTGCDRELQIVTKKEKQTRRTTFSRLVKKGVVVRDPDREGYYRRVLNDCDDIDFMNAPEESMDVKWVFGLERYINTFPKTITVIAGSQDAGKTALMLNMAALNMRRFNVSYFSSEMDGTELKNRLKGYEGLRLEDWLNVKFKDRSRDFEDVIDPDGINLIDYLEISKDFFKVGQVLTDIRNRLKTGIAIVALQKKKGDDLGRGAEFSLEKPRLYMSVEPLFPGTKVKIIKAKNWRHPDINPNGLVMKFKTVKGCRLLPQGTWEVE
jgi:hypothetical protein